MNRALLLFVAPALALSGCDLIASAKSTTVVGGLLIATPEVKLAGQFDVKSQVAATAFVGERASATSTDQPAPIQGANVNVSFAGNVVNLKEQMSPAGFYEADSTMMGSGLVYAEGQTYIFTAKTGDSTEFGGNVVAPTRLSDASLSFTPEPQPIPMVQDVKSHPKSTDLKVSWQAQNGRYAYVTVLRGDPAHPDQPQVVFDNQPRTSGEIIQFIVGTPPTSITIPASAFAEDGAYAVIVVAANKGDPQTNTFLGSPILAGSGAALILAVGMFHP